VFLGRRDVRKTDHGLGRFGVFEDLEIILLLDLLRLRETEMNISDLFSESREGAREGIHLESCEVVDTERQELGTNVQDSNVKEYLRIFEINLASNLNARRRHDGQLAYSGVQYSRMVFRCFYTLPATAEHYLVLLGKLTRVDRPERLIFLTFLAHCRIQQYTMRRDHRCQLYSGASPFPPEGLGDCDFILPFSSKVVSREGERV
jgi:hypothetical protein